jgi:SH3-like domain-containing protein
MRFPDRVSLALAWVLTVGASPVGASQVWAQNLSLPTAPQGPSGVHHDQSAKPPKAAPREPVHRVGGGGTSSTPVVPAHGPIHPHRPAAAASSAGKAVPAQPVPPVAAPNPPASQAPASQKKVAQPEKPTDAEKSDTAPAKLPRFAALRSDEVNMRAGPGTRYRIDWVYKRRDLPVEIEREFDVWRWVRDADGIQGWVHQATLMGRRSFIVEKADATLRSEASDSAQAVAILKAGVIGRIRSCEAASDWCNVQAGSYRGYLHREQFWGVLPNEAIAP